MTRRIFYLRHMLGAIERIEAYVAVGHARFMAETHWQDAVIRQLEIIGEATKRLSPALRARYPHVPWRRVAGLRDVLIHDSMGVDLDAVWETTRQPLLDLKREIVLMLGTEDET